MNRSWGKAFLAAFVALLLACSGVLIWYAVVSENLRFRIADTGISLETSRGRELRQTAEFNTVSETLPLARAELTDLQPRAQAATDTVNDLKQRRSDLRQANQDLEDEITALGGEIPPEVSE